MIALMLGLIVSTPLPSPTPVEPIATPSETLRLAFCRTLTESIPEVCAARPERMGGCAAFRSQLCTEH